MSDMDALQKRVKQLVVENARQRQVINEAFDLLNKRRHELIDKKHMGGLTVDEANELERMRLACEKLLEPYDWPIKEGQAEFEKALARAQELLDSAKCS